LINALIGCIYFVNQEQEKTLTTRIYHNFSSINPIETIERTLSSEYNHGDLNRFYSRIREHTTFEFQCQRNLTADKSICSTR